MLLNTAYGDWPTAKSSKIFTETIKVSGPYDGGLTRFIASHQSGDGGQGEH